MSDYDRSGPGVMVAPSACHARACCSFIALVQYRAAVWSDLSDS